MGVEITDAVKVVQGERKETRGVEKEEVVAIVAVFSSEANEEEVTWIHSIALALRVLSEISGGGSSDLLELHSSPTTTTGQQAPTNSHFWLSAHRSGQKLGKSSSSQAEVLVVDGWGYGTNNVAPRLYLHRAALRRPISCACGWIDLPEREASG
ncbi:hypothetical protein [Oryza sativa Japonica Group]|uniref:Uncharacterized protein n=1 Tax=Oryza sativa subsp. japonica TaxID=39947 RepID=Q5ZBB0_ORYSJ|nr:hypothetical protein [Oryza sativa Japonica Group]BAD53118.1 hypothetical protein [Oryza sativa Japonica Group]